MWLWVSMILLAFSVSVDSLSVGITYGMGGVRFSCFSLALIAFMSGAVVFASMNIGRLLALFLPLQVERGLASVILIALGGWAIYNVYKPKGDGSDSSMESDGTGEANRFSGAVQVLKRPELGDLDRSGTISQKEAVLIGLALSMDAFGAGISSSLLHFPPLSFALLVGVFNLVFIRVGLSLGYMVSKTGIMKKATMLPGVVLIVLGFIKLFR
ncbi:rhomboid family serine protease [Geobacillus proteiniphilus]|uniref:Rhomboid family serine protease n=1 Tax=Geobacillus proteiniphilus TaxID=860353 RepID=A0A1Q5SUA1_9BACL|nr:sporulation membrane protein YtaF [Geobacillus proteiniphilus]OKO91540.1 rhomboid family serine protease [Geobacillus proteiniphilus]